MIAIACDHGGYQLKQWIMKNLDEQNISYKDFGTYSEESCEYPAYAEAVGKAVAAGEYDKGILVCGTGIGMCIAANKIKGVRAAVCTDCYCAELTRRHNDANILTLGERVVGAGLAMKIVDTFLGTPFEGSKHKHVRRVEMIRELEE